MADLTLTRTDVPLPDSPAALKPLMKGRQTRAAILDAALKPLMKGRQTRAAILDAALTLASHMGLEGLSIGALAEATEMSKSGVFAHFGSREELQISVVREYHAKFEEEVFVPAMRERRGLPRLRALFERWVRRVSAEIDSGCIYISGAVEFDDRPGPVRDALVAMVRTWQAALERAIRAAIAQGHLRADTDPQQVLFEVHGLILALHHDARFLQSPGAAARARLGFERLLAPHVDANTSANTSTSTNTSTNTNTNPITGTGTGTGTGTAAGAGTDVTPRRRRNGRAPAAPSSSSV